jgi:hypothetical protein
MMSKQINHRLVLLSIGSFLALGAILVIPTVSAKKQQPGMATGTARNASIVATTEALLKETSDLRELSILKDVKSGAQSRAEIQRMIIKNLDEESSPAQIHATEVALKAQGLAPPEFQYRPFLIKLLTEQVAGYYDPKVQQFYLADWIELEGQKPVMAHELTHALQDQHFNLRRFEKWPKGDSDAELAAHALIEGDATLAMTLYLAKHPLVALAFIKSLGADGLASEQFKQAPRAIRESLMFPYEQGSEWATQLYKREGWELVSKAFSKLPQSSEQILHADKYFSGEAPVKLTLPDFKGSLGLGWKMIDSDVNGEFGLYLILDQFLNAAEESKEAAAGWAGDRCVVYEGPKSGEAFIANLTAWDTDNDSKEFFEAYAKRTLKRYPEAKPLTEKPVVSATGERQEWKTVNGTVAVERRGLRVLILEGVPATKEASELSRAIW